MDATLLSDLLEYRKDRDRAVVAAARSLLHLFREKMPELLHKKQRGRGVDMSARPAEYGAVHVATSANFIRMDAWSGVHVTSSITRS